MMQPNAAAPLYAQQAAWVYWGITEDAVERDFYISLQPVVVNAIREQLFKSQVARLWVGRELQLNIGSYKLRAKLTNMEPLLANSFDASTAFLAGYRQRPQDERQDTSAFITEIIRYPSKRLAATYDSLVGIDEIKDDMLRKLGVLLDPRSVDTWLQRNYPNRVPSSLAQVLRDRYPLLILEGEVGSGKTALARSVGSILADHMKRQIALFIVNAQVRGGGHVGELTQNISRAFDEAERCQEQEQIPVMLLIDEADALAQARGGQQTHHEDDAGVNTLIQRIDRLRGRPMAVIFATNLFQSLDSAILRRATAVFHFDRPNVEQRRAVFNSLLAPLGFNKDDVWQLVGSTDPYPIPSLGDSYHRFTYSDLSQRIVTYAVERALTEKKPLDSKHLLDACIQTFPTPEILGIDIKNLRDFGAFFVSFPSQLTLDEDVIKDTQPITYYEKRVSNEPNR